LARRVASFLSSPSRPAKADRETVAGAMFEVLDGVIRHRDAVYVSVPITTGKRFLEWRRGLGAGLSPSRRRYQREHAFHVVEPNRRHVKPIIALVEERLKRIVIDPTTLGHVPNWTQADYHAFWTQVIERYVSTVVFMDGWEFSSGCTYEFLTAVHVGAQLLREDLTPLRLEEGEQLIQDAIAALDDEVLPTAPLREALGAIHNAGKRGERNISSS
jgi:hypothetical protein